jgi:preprotein translocase subunit SecF
MGWVSAELNLAMIAAFLTIIGYSINDTIVIFDRIRENLSDQARLGDTKESFRELINRSINQTLSRTILTSSTTLFVVLAQFAVNYGRGSALEGFSFALIVGIITGTYSTMFIASPMVLWLREREVSGDKPGVVSQPRKPVPVGTGS